MSELTREELHHLARMGAKARLEELRREEVAIRRSFPDLFKNGRGPAAPRESGIGSRRRRRRAMSAAARRAVSERMKKYWADRKKGKGSK